MKRTLFGLALLLAAALLAGCGSLSDQSPTQSTAPTETKGLTPMTYPGDSTAVPPSKTESGLAYIDIVPGTGQSPQSGDKVTVHYAGYLLDGKKFDSSVDRGKPFTFTIGQGQVIKGWDEGVMTMKVGGKRKLIIPPELGYGMQRAGGGLIPPNSTLVFDVQLINVGQ